MQAVPADMRFIIVSTFQSSPLEYAFETLRDLYGFKCFIFKYTKYAVDGFRKFYHSQRLVFTEQLNTFISNRLTLLIA